MACWVQGAAAPAETHTLPDGQSITVGGEGIELAEALVEGSTLGSESPSAAAAVYNACMSNPDPAVRKVGPQQRLPLILVLSLVTASLAPASAALCSGRFRHHHCGLF